MSTLSRIIAEREALALKAEIEAKRKPKKKAAKRDENGRFIKTTAVKELIVKLLEAYAKSTDNELDDRALQIVKKGLDIE